MHACVYRHVSTVFILPISLYLPHVDLRNTSCPDFNSTMLISYQNSHYLYTFHCSHTSAKKVSSKMCLWLSTFNFHHLILGVACSFWVTLITPFDIQVYHQYMLLRHSHSIHTLVTRGSLRHWDVLFPLHKRIKSIIKARTCFISIKCILFNRLI